MRHVALICTLDQGQRGHASTADLVAAFTDDGCRNPTPFRSNGTVVFEGEASLAAEAMSALAARTGVAREVFAH